MELRFHQMNERKDLNAHIEHRLSLALDRFPGTIRRVVMHVYDRNGPRLIA